eukprot:jgi/Undpi1/2204/HiC_scaffold_12.g05590.m1
MGAARSTLHTGRDTDSTRKRHRLGFSRVSRSSSGGGGPQQDPPTNIPPSSGSGSASSSSSSRRSGDSSPSSSPPPRTTSPALATSDIDASINSRHSSSGGNTATTPDLLRKAPHRRRSSLSLPGGASGGVPSPLMRYSKPRPTSGGAPARPDSGSRQSFRMIRQPSTYGDLHEMVAKQKLGNGVRGLVGLQNIGNTCFMNSALQCLVNCEALADYFLGFDWPAEINKANILGHKGVVAGALGKLANQMWFTDQRDIRPSEFKEQIGEAMPLFEGYEQQDVQEYLAFLLDAIHEDLNRVPNAARKYVEAKEAKEGEAEEFVAMQAWKGYLERNRSIIVDLFQGQLRSALQCNVCGRRSVTFDPFMYLSVPLPPDAVEDRGRQDDCGGGGPAGAGVGGAGRRRGRPEKPEGVSLESCIERFCEEETLEGDNAWYCSTCKKHQPATKKLELWKVPPVLIVHLKRFGGGAKISLPVLFPLVGLDLSHVVKSPQREPPDYDLYATANHHGSVQFGHYTAAAKNRMSGKWNLFNDDRVEELEPEEVQTSSAYVLFFTKMSTIDDPLDEDLPSVTDATAQQQPPPTSTAAGAAAGGGRAARAGSSGGGGGRSSTASPPRRGRSREPGEERGFGAKNRTPSPLRAAAVVRRQSVSKPQHWPHVGTFEPAFKSLVEPTSPKASPMEFSPPGTNGTLRVSGSVGAVEAPNLRRRGAEQGYGEPPDGGTLPPIGATAGGASPVASDSSAAGGGSGRRSSGRSEELPAEAAEVEDLLNQVSVRSADQASTVVRSRTRVVRFLSKWFLPKRMQQPVFDVLLQEGPSRRSSLEDRQDLD